MHLRRHLLAILLVHGAACGPEVLGETDGESSSTGEPDPGSSSVTDGPTEPTSTSTSTSTDTPVPTTTGEPSGCPEGQPWSSLGSAVLTVPEGFAAATGADGMVVMADGRIAVAGVIEGMLELPAVLFLSPAGEVLGMTNGAPSEATSVSGLWRAADDSLVLYLARADTMTVTMSLLRFAPDGSSLGEVPLATQILGAGFVLADDGGAVIAGRERPTGIPRVAKFAVETGAAAWSVELDEPGESNPTRVAIAPEGDIVIAGSGSEDLDGNATLHRMWRLGGDGQLRWSGSQVKPPFSHLTAIASLPNGQVATLRRGPDDDQTVDLLAVDFLDGSPEWETTIAVPDADELPYGRALLVDADALSIPVMRSEPEFSALRSIAVQRVSFGGQLLDLVPLDVPARPSRGWTTLGVRGNCEELVILTGELADLWLGSFAP